MLNSDPTSAGSLNTHFYLGDHLGTAQMEFAAGGWPVWQGQFAPYGGELHNGMPVAADQPDSTTANHYKFTGKERDTESGLDYFGARYYASNMGRWMSPDWAAKAIPVPYAKLDNPQTLNLYAYVGNNPLSRRDPDGHYQCSGSKDQCAAIKGALDVVRKADANLKEGSKERTRLDKVLSFYGAEGQKNGVNVNFGKLDGAVGETGTSSFFGFFKTTTITFDSGAISKFGDAGKGETVAHEGTHGVDQREGETGTNPYARAFYGELHAYQSESYVDKGLGVRTESDGNNPVWAPRMSGNQSAEAIRQNAKANADQDCKGGGCNP